MAQSFPLWQTVGSDAQWRWIHHVLFISVIARRLYVNKDRNSGLSILHHLSQTLFKKHSFHSENKKYLPHFSYASDKKQTRGNMGHALHYGYEMVPWCDVSAASIVHDDIAVTDWRPRHFSIFLDWEWRGLPVTKSCYNVPQIIELTQRKENYLRFVLFVFVCFLFFCFFTTDSNRQPGRALNFEGNCGVKNKLRKKL